MSGNRQRSVGIIALISIVGLLFLVRLFYLQVMDKSLAEKAAMNSIKKITIHPNRGLILDRHGKLIASTDLVYDLMVSYPIMLKGLDTVEFCKVMEIDLENFEHKLEQARKSAYKGKATFLKNLDKRDYVRLKERIDEFNGFFIETRTDRKYHYPIAAHVLGYIGEISKSELQADSNAYYELGDYIGKNGLEKFYENELRGKKGYENILVDVRGKSQGSYKGGSFDQEPHSGASLFSSLDAELQLYGEEMMKGKMGSIVAIEPRSGEILCMVSSPGYDPNQFTIRNRGKYYGELATRQTKPLYNRAVNAQYPPGSIFKLVQGLIALEEGQILPSTTYSCRGGFNAGRLHVGCHAHSSPVNLQQAIGTSCNAYFCNVMRELMDKDEYGSVRNAYLNWTDHLHHFGLGNRLGVDVNNEASGIVKAPEYYDRIHGKDRWNYLRIISLSIGQGELGITPVQMANISAIIANKGYFYTPHFVKRFEGQKGIPFAFRKMHLTKVSREHFETVAAAMAKVMDSGTGAGSKIPGIDASGKTGTVQNPHGKDHSVFIAFAPRDNPKIAISVVVENSGYGATWAAPIANLMIEKYLRPEEETQREDLYQRITNATLIDLPLVQ